MSASVDLQTAQAFSTSWNTLPSGSVYTRDQVEEWLAPITTSEISGKEVLELGCGNGSLLVHVSSFGPASLTGVDLGDSVISARQNMASLAVGQWKVEQADLVAYNGEKRDIVYCIGVLHHLTDPYSGFLSVIRNTKSGGKFHCWVYGKEGNWVVIHMVDPLRKIVSKLPWWVTKYLVALPLSFPFFLYAKLIASLPSAVDRLPLASYCRWIAKRGFRFFWHVAFDQLVTPQTCYLDEPTLRSWLASTPGIERNSTYLIQRNGNSWKFGGIVRR